MLAAVPVLFSSSVFANQTSCIDDDGDGWGWNGTSSCQVGAAQPTSGGLCVDDDGDGWGWDGTASCLVNSTDGSGTTVPVQGSVCIDDDGDGWGWDGTASCVAVGSGGSIPPAQGTACVDDDGDGWGWDGYGSCQVTTTSTPAVPAPPSDLRPPATGRFGANDLLAAHFDHGPDPDDGHAAAAAYVIAQELSLNMVVAGGTTGEYSAGRYLSESENLMRQIFGQQWLDAHNNRATSAEQAAQRWVGAMANGGDVWVAEGGPSDFTAAVLRVIQRDYPEYNTRRRVHVIQHSKWNEDHALRGDLNFVRANAEYIRIEDGNDPNSTADLRQDGGSATTQNFVSTARGSRYGNVWNYAFNYLNPNEKLDFSDTVEVLYILNIGLGDISDVTDFGEYFLR